MFARLCLLLAPEHFTQVEETTNKLRLLSFRSPPRSNAKWMLCCEPRTPSPPFANCHGGMPSHASDLYHTMNAGSAVQRGHK